MGIQGNKAVSQYDLLPLTLLGISMENLLNEITEVLLFLKITTYALLALSLAWVIFLFRKIVGLDTHSIELRRIRRLLEQLSKEKTE